jgi:phosphosulfolactate phosphohydrolase-like enzyme
MRDEDWKTANAIARDLVDAECDPNEVHKAFVYLRTHKDGQKFLRLVDAMARHGRFLMRSGRTRDYYRAMHEVFGSQLAPYKKDAVAMAEVLGWSIRLMRFYMAQPNRAGRTHR